MSVTEFETEAVSTQRPSDDWSRPLENINWPMKAIITNVLATDDPNNLSGQTLCDVQIVDGGYTLSRIPIYATSFHQDTSPSDPLGRQTRDPKSRMIFSGESWTPEVGTICIVMFIGAPGPNREAAIMGFCSVSNQALPHVNRKESESLFPREAQAVTTFDDSGQLTEEYRSRLQATESESPRWTRVQNGSALEIDNRGNVNIQTTISRDPIQTETYDNFDYTKAREGVTADPEGNIILSTRGARRGNIGIVTGRIQTEGQVVELLGADGSVVKRVQVTVREDVDEQNEEGNIVLSTKDAAEGRISAEAEGDIDVVSLLGRIGLDAEIINLVAKELVRVGSLNATQPAVLGGKLLSWILSSVLGHVHGGVRTGPGMTGPSSITLPSTILSKKVLIAT